MVKGVKRSIIGGRGGGGGTIFIYSCSQTVKIIDFKRNELCRTRIYEYGLGLIVVVCKPHKIKFLLL